MTTHDDTSVDSVRGALEIISAAVRSGVGDEINARRTYFVSRGQSFTPDGTVATKQTFKLPDLAAQLVRLKGVTVSYSPWLNGAPAVLTQFRLRVGGGSGNPTEFDLPLFGGVMSIALEQMIQPHEPIEAYVTGVPAGNTQQLTLFAWGEQEPVLGTAT